MLCAGPCQSLLEHSVKEGDNPVRDTDRPVLCERPSKSRVVWECSSKGVVNSI
ncbi:hypothetical protein L969DRAFT_613907 [Mixia osmundae IAM 14324]|nr:hypothetical protein L969DRAFT_613907 [Mixia osmundae IAM 14324]